jgi:PPOX class probable F420-dependent enzyme
MLDPEVRKLASEANYSVVSTIMPRGDIQSSPMWVDCDDDHILINTERERQRTRNVERDARITVLIVDLRDWYRFAEVRGRVVEIVGGDVARRHIDALARKYTGAEYANPIGSERVILKIEPTRQRARL